MMRSLRIFIRGLQTSLFSLAAILAQAGGYLGPGLLIRGVDAVAAAVAVDSKEKEGSSGRYKPV